MFFRRCVGLGFALASALAPASASTLALALTLGACAGPVAYPPSAPSHLLSQPLPEFSRPSLDGGRIDVQAMRGRAVVVKFFAEYCEPCKRTLPAAERLHREHPEVAFVGVSEDDYADIARKVGESYGLTFPIVHDVSKALKGRFRISEMPATFVADRQGVVRWVGGPGQTERDMAQAIRAAER